MVWSPLSSEARLPTAMCTYPVLRCLIYTGAEEASVRSEYELPIVSCVMHAGSAATVGGAVQCWAIGW